jgi:hypothetical protein
VTTPPQTSAPKIPGSGSPRSRRAPFGDVPFRHPSREAGGLASPSATPSVDDLDAARRAYNAHVPGCPLCTTTAHCELGALLDTHVSQLFARRLMRAVEA